MNYTIEPWLFKIIFSDGENPKILPITEMNEKYIKCVNLRPMENSDKYMIADISNKIAYILNGYRISNSNNNKVLGFIVSENSKKGVFISPNSKEFEGEDECGEIAFKNSFCWSKAITPGRIEIKRFFKEQKESKKIFGEIEEIIKLTDKLIIVQTSDKKSYFAIPSSFKYEMKQNNETKIINIKDEDALKKFSNFTFTI